MAKILVVDDEIESRERLSEFLTMRGFEVETASRGSAALEKIAADPPDLVLLDVRMPGMNGLQILKAAKALHPDLGVIMVTAVPDGAITREAMKLGAYDYITKPIDINYLATKVIPTFLALIG